MRCCICGWYNDKHDSNCPRELSGATRERYDRGWSDGRNSRPIADADDPIYGFGWINGDIACDEWWNS